MAARYEGNPSVRFLNDGRNVELLQPLAFIDPAETRWAVPAGAVVDGASIPRFLWPVVGGPFEGNYRDASIIHDWFCDKRTRTWQATHRVFFEAMLASAVSFVKAKIMYAAVYWGGPRWDVRVSHNTNLPVDPGFESIAEKIVVPIDNLADGLDEQEKITRFKDLKARIEAGDYSLDGIDELASDFANK